MNLENNSRRKFLKNSSLASMAVVSANSLYNESPIVPIPEDGKLKKNATILFQGDSITDAQRRKDHYYPNNGLGMGCGYVQLISSRILAEYSDYNFKIYNRGISGNKVHQLANRWEDDCLQLKPDLMSVMIGVNDFWHTLTHNYKGTVATYKGDLRKLLDRTLKARPDLILILMEPFVVLGGTAIDEKAWVPAFKAYQQAATELAKEYNAHFIPLQSKLDEISKTTAGTYWAPDGVHPSMAGNYKIARWWLEVFEKVCDKTQSK